VLEFEQAQIGNGDEVRDRPEAACGTLGLLQQAIVGLLVDLITSSFPGAFISYQSTPSARSISFSNENIVSVNGARGMIISSTRCITVVLLNGTRLILRTTS
jgi:hypothetical protein